MRQVWIALWVVAGCWTTSQPSEVRSNETPRAKPGLFTISPARFGPIDARVPATLTALRGVFPGYDVKPVNDGSLEYDVFDHGERLLFVVPNDDGSVFNVQATSGKIGVADRAWRVGQPLENTSAVTTCECWGPNPTCYAKGEHVAVNFKLACAGVIGNAHWIRKLAGVPIQRVIWSPTAFGEAGYGGQMYGGDSYGGGDPCAGN